jgi:hypothetical protein
MTGEVPAMNGSGATPEKVMHDLWSRTLSQVPTAFGRIVYLASLRNLNSGKYEHFGLARIYSEEQSDAAIRLSHTQAVAEWLNFPLAQQKSDLEEYLDGLEGGRRQVLGAWAALMPQRGLLPADASEAEKQLFLSDLELILEMLRNELSPSSTHPAA